MRKEDATIRKAYMRYVKQYLRENMALLEGYDTVEYFILRGVHFKPFSDQFRTTPTEDESRQKNFYRAFNLKTGPEETTADQIQKAFGIPLSVQNFYNELHKQNPFFKNFLEEQKAEERNANTNAAPIIDEEILVFGSTDNPEIWTGFIDNFKSYNDPWLLEFKNPNNFIKTHRKRYKKEDCVFRFLFFKTSDEYASFKRFIKFQSMVHLGLNEADLDDNIFLTVLERKIKKGVPQTLNKIKAVVLNDTTKPRSTAFRGYKEINGKKEKVSLWYNDIDPETGEPFEIFYSSSPLRWKRFDDNWEMDAQNALEIAGEKIFDEYIELKNTNKIK